MHYSFEHGAAKMIPLFMMFAGGPLGTGRQWYTCLLTRSYFSWIHASFIMNLAVKLDHSFYITLKDFIF